MLKFDSCCCCIPLRIGCLVVGYIYLIGAVIHSILAIIVLELGVYNLSIGSEAKTSLGTRLIVKGAINFTFSFLLLIFDTFLLVGLHKNRRSYVKAFLIYNLVFFIIWTVLFFVSLALDTHGGLSIVVWILELGLSIYFLLVILSYYNGMNSNTTFDTAPPYEQ